MIRCLASWMRLYVSIGGCGLFSSAVPWMGVKAKRAGKTCMSMHCWMMLMASFSVSPRPMIMCVLTFPFPKISLASRSCLSCVSHWYGPPAVGPLISLNSFFVAASRAMPMRFTPASASFCMFWLFSGWHEIEIGVFVCCFMAFVRAARCVNTLG